MLQGVKVTVLSVRTQEMYIRAVLREYVLYLKTSRPHILSTGVP